MHSVLFVVDTEEPTLQREPLYNLIVDCPVRMEYVKNHLGMKLSDDEMASVPYPVTELTTHVTIKDVQAFGLLGTLLFGPINALRSPATRNLAGLAAKCTKAGRIGVIVGLVAGPAMTYAKVRSLDEDAIVDRCYRLRNNRGQVRVDQASIIGGVAGVVVGMSQANPALGFLLGMSSGVLGAAVYNAKK